jgi:hypothetical protein
MVPHRTSSPAVWGWAGCKQLVGDAVLCLSSKTNSTRAGEALSPR